MSIRIRVNELSLEVEEGTTLFDVWRRQKPGADLLIYNGMPVAESHSLQENDRIVLITRGEIPTEAEFETLLTSRHTPGVHERIRKNVVGIAGAGGLGSAVAVALARMGVGKLVIADYDIVEPSNLNRQQYFVDQIGLPKVLALRDNLARINPYVRVTCHHERITPDNLKDLFEECQVVVEAFDRADQKAMLLNAFSRHLKTKTLVAASGLAGYGSSNTIRTTAFTKNIVIVGDQVEAACIGTGLMAPRVGIAAHHQANAVLRILLGCDPAE